MTKINALVRVSHIRQPVVTLDFTKVPVAILMTEYTERKLPVLMVSGWLGWEDDGMEKWEKFGKMAKESPGEVLIIVHHIPNGNIWNTDVSAMRVSLGTADGDMRCLDLE